MIDSLMNFLDLVNGGTWSFLVGGLSCQVYSGNERDLISLINMLNDRCHIS